MFELYIVLVVVMYMLPMIIMAMYPEDPLDPIETIVKENNDAGETNYYSIEIPKKLCVELSGAKYIFYANGIFKKKDGTEYVIEDLSLEAHIVNNIRRKRYAAYMSNDGKYDIAIYTGH